MLNKIFIKSAKIFFSMTAFYLPVFVVVGIIFSPFTVLLNKYGGNLAKVIFTLVVLSLALILDYPSSLWFIRRFEGKRKFFSVLIVLYLASTVILISIILLYVFAQKAANLIF